MAKTRHQTVVKAGGPGVAKSNAKNSDLKQAAHQGKAPVKTPRIAPPGFAAVPVSVATMPPGEGPPMSSTPSPVGRGGSKPKSKATGSRASAQAIQAAAPVVSQQGGVAGGAQKNAAKSRSRGRRKR